MDHIKLFDNFNKYYGDAPQFSQLIGKIIDDIYIDDDFQKLCFVTEDNEYHCYYTVIDCCNEVWFNHFNGIDFIRWQRVMSVESKEWREVDIYVREDDSEEACSWTLITKRGYIDIEVRNSHNGYYGGGVSYHLGDISDISHMKKISEDF